jgi:hypothetical protein
VTSNSSGRARRGPGPGSSSLALRAGAELAKRLVQRGEVDRGRRLLTPLRAACVGSSPELEAIDARLEPLLGMASGSGQ